MNTNYFECGDCAELLRLLPDASVDLVMTSPPYAERRKDTYGGIAEADYPEWIAGIAKEIHRVLKNSGSFVLNIKENVVDGRRSTYVLESVLRIAQIFRWTDTYVWVKPNPFPTGNRKRLKDGFEYCFWFTKSKGYKFFPEQVLVPSANKDLEAEKRRKNKGEHPVTNGSGMNMSRRVATDMVRPSNVLTLPVDSTNHEHPASFPVALPTFFIKAMTEEGDVVLDPFAGSGTTLFAAQQLGRDWIGFEIIPRYTEIAQERLAEIV
ncbi:MAG: site-specific DNA-methyltransferase [Oscillospiraceae bacterium]|nr:site-specific DNA-methyltransferase [Parasporobacterium sp.]MBQ9685395.1 site-specific DNA-methyltransferase [Oscillospiraceae bacterium]